MKITGVYCHIAVHMNAGVPTSATMYTVVEHGGKTDRDYFRKLSPMKACIAIYKLAHAQGMRPEIRYNIFDPKLSSKEIVWYREA